MFFYIVINVRLSEIGKRKLYDRFPVDSTGTKSLCFTLKYNPEGL